MKLTFFFVGQEFNFVDVFDSDFHPTGIFLVTICRVFEIFTELQDRKARIVGRKDFALATVGTLLLYCCFEKCPDAYFRLAGIINCRSIDAQIFARGGHLHLVPSFFRLYYVPDSDDVSF